MPNSTIEVTEANKKMKSAAQNSRGQNVQTIIIIISSIYSSKIVHYTINDNIQDNIKRQYKNTYIEHKKEKKKKVKKKQKLYYPVHIKRIIAVKVSFISTKCSLRLKTPSRRNMHSSNKFN